MSPAPILHGPNLLVDVHQILGAVILSACNLEFPKGLGLEA